MKLYDTRFALSRGIITREGEPSASRSGLFRLNYKNGCEWASPREVFTAREEAVARAEKKRLAKIASLERQIARLRSMDFGEAP